MKRVGLVLPLAAAVSLLACATNNLQGCRPIAETVAGLIAVHRLDWRCVSMDSLQEAWPSDLELRERTLQGSSPATAIELVQYRGRIINDSCFCCDTFVLDEYLPGGSCSSSRRLSAVVLKTAAPDLGAAVKTAATIGDAVVGKGKVAFTPGVVELAKRGQGISGRYEIGDSGSPAEVVELRIDEEQGSWVVYFYFSR